MGLYIFKYIENYEAPVENDNYQKEQYNNDYENDYYNDYYYEDDYYSKTYDNRIYKYSSSFQTDLLELYEDYYIYDSTSFGNVDFNITSSDESFLGNIYTYGKKGSFSYSVIYYDDRNNVINSFDDEVNITKSYENFELYGINKNANAEYKYYKFVVKDLVLFNEG